MKKNKKSKLTSIEIFIAAFVILIICSVLVTAGLDLFIDSSYFFSISWFMFVFASSFLVGLIAAVVNIFSPLGE